MLRIRIKYLLKRALISSGIKPLFLLTAINGCFAFGAWLKKYPAEKIFPAREELYHYINTAILKNNPIDYLEFGVWEGTSLKFWSEMNLQPASRFFGFDSFKGLPEQWNAAFSCSPKNSFNLDGKVPEFNDPRIKLIVGYFNQTLSSFLAEFKPQNRIIVNIDCDIYSSTIFVLASLSGTLTPGSILIFDEFNLVGHEFRALQDITNAFAINYKIIAATDTHNQVALEII